ncbi:KAP family P-loop NTPase fold protein [Salinirubrum litoreum]|uniref:P-loop NTPase fold protein n=1 Tax=Salinirubrum litoreum TaxID=1126234 RepID=A0ABD5R7A6_9EURY|nr:P-loop NTPase fold protein [Salinirubrum litoreum]
MADQPFPVLTEEVERLLPPVDDATPIPAVELLLSLVDPGPDSKSEVPESSESADFGASRPDPPEWLYDTTLQSGDAATAEARTLPDWLSEIRLLYEEQMVSALSVPAVVVGVGILVPDLGSQLVTANFLGVYVDELVAEHGVETFTDLLTDEGRKSAERVIGNNGPPPIEHVPIHADDPLTDADADELGRDLFAEYLALRLRDARAATSGAYSVHLDGPWGAGKSTLLHFLDDHLTAPRTADDDRETAGGTDDATPAESDGAPTPTELGDEWVVVHFNAWQHQHLRPPWWALLDRIFHDTRSQLLPGDRLRQRWWRFSRSGRLAAYALVGVFGWVVVGTLLAVAFAGPDSLAEPGTVVAQFVANADALGAIFGVVVAGLALRDAVVSPTVPRSAHAAQRYVDYRSEPMTEITALFGDLIESVQRSSPPGRRRQVAVFVDDLDRCASEYVVELLEGIQTLFRRAPVVFVVAGDGQWLTTCFESVYAGHEAVAETPGTSLGTLFVEKTFQFSAPVPGIDPALQSAYWQGLTRVRPPAETGDGQSSDLIDSRETPAGVTTAPTAKTGTPETDTVAGQDEDAEAEVGPGAEDASVRERVEARRADVRSLASRREQAASERLLLSTLGDLLAPNPRGMKRLVNTYSANRALALIAGADLSEAVLARWTILSLRWPALADYLARHPEQVTSIGVSSPPDVDEDLQTLFADESGDVWRTAFGEVGDSVEPLDAEAVRDCAAISA